MTTLPLPKLYWDTFQAAMQSKVKRLAKEIATTLGESEQPLLKALITEKVDVYLVEEEGDEMIDLQSMRCRHIQPTPENAAVLRRCGQPVIKGKAACLHHQLHGTTTVTPMPNGQELPVWQSARDTDGITHHGFLFDENKIRVFKIQTTRV
jgi:hypothetical protein